MLAKVEATDNGQKPSSSYVGAFPNMSTEALLSLAPVRAEDPVELSTRLFLARYHAFPCTSGCRTEYSDGIFHLTTITDYVREELKHDLDYDYTNETYDHKTEQIHVHSCVCDLGDGLMIEMHNIQSMSGLENPNNLKADDADGRFLTVSTVNFHFLPECRTRLRDILSRMSKMTVLLPKPILPRKSYTLQMVCRNQHGYYLRSIKIKKPSITDLALHYGNDFPPIHEKMIRLLNKKKEKGIVFLHGIPGAGKTHYIRYLIHEIQRKTLIYIPPDMAKEISAPEFLAFLMQYPNSILIIEDAENIIKDRNESSTPSQAVANLLNLADGLLGDAMHQQIIATFNCDLTSIDPALLRQGRLIVNHEFNKLDLESSKALSNKLGFGTENITKPMTLAEIYNQGEIQQQEDEDDSSSDELDMNQLITPDHW